MKTPAIVITGANRGIGLAFTQHYRARGAHVTALCRHPSLELEATGAQVLEGVDVTSPDSLRAAAEKVGTPVDVLIANAGLLTDEPFESLSEPAAADRIRRQFEVNALGALLTVHAFSNRLERGARVAIMTSRMGSIADNTSGGRYGYRMSKAALNAAAQSLAVDLKPRGVAVAVLHPGYVRTEMTSRHGDVEPEQAAANLIERIDALDLETTGTFWHANGTVLPW